VQFTFESRTPGFPVELVGVAEVHAVPAGRDRTRGRIQRSLQEIRDRLRATAEHLSA
jgi:hypothetical protein